MPMRKAVSGLDIGRRCRGDRVGLTPHVWNTRAWHGQACFSGCRPAGKEPSEHLSRRRTQEEEGAALSKSQ